MTEFIWFLYLLLIAGVMIALVRVWGLSGSKKKRPLKRTCPLCGSTLTQNQSLLASEIRKNQHESELKIKGCPYCYQRVTDG